MKRLIVLFLFVSATLNAQYSINGTMSPVENSSWVLLYKIEGTKQIFVKNTQVKKDGKTKLLNKGIIVRKLSSFGWQNCIRISIGTSEENVTLLNALKSIIH